MTTVTFGENTTDSNNDTCEDCLIYEASPDSNHEGSYIGMGKGSAANRTNRSVIRFDVKDALTASGISSIVSAKLYLYVSGKAGTHNISAYRVFQDWIVNQVTWNSWKTGSTWSGSGCSAASDAGVDDGAYDRKATAEDTALAGAVGGYNLVLDLTDLTRKWYDGTAKEYGILLQSDNETTNNYTTCNDENDDDGKRPYLEVEYLLFEGYFSGYVYEQDESGPVSRTVRLYRRDTGALMNITTSSGDGYYYIETSYSGSHYIIALDDEVGTQYNLAALDWMMPITISG